MSHPFDLSQFPDLPPEVAVTELPPTLPVLAASSAELAVLVPASVELAARAGYDPSAAPLPDAVQAACAASTNTRLVLSLVLAIVAVLVAAA